MYTLPDSLRQEIEEYKGVVEEFKGGKLDNIKFKSVRVPHGIYEQRGNDIFMARIRCASGFVSPAQLKRVGELARDYGKLVHITTRQELQIHNILIDDTYEVIKGLYNVGLGTRGSGGNTIRNIMGSTESGVDSEDVFDITPYVVALTNKMVVESDSWELPRKVKMSFSSNDKDSSLAAFNDIGFIAKLKDGKRGFQVILGGGAASKPQIGHTLFEFAPEEELFAIVDAIKKMFNKYGNRRNKHKARMRFLFYKYGAENVVEFFNEFYAQTKTLEKNRFSLPELNYKTYEPAIKPLAVDTADFETWKRVNVFSQVQNGLYQVFVPFHHGNVSPEATIKLAEFLENFGDDTIRCTMRQNFVLRNIPGDYLGNVYQLLKELEVEVENPYFINQLVSCTGADTCKLGICLSKGALNSIKTALLKTDIDFEKLSQVRINISGCPNSCGQQMMADLGFFGKAGRQDRLYPAYNVVAGAVIGGDSPRLAEKIAEVNAYDLSKFVTEVLEDYVSKIEKYPSFTAYYDAEGKDAIIEIAQKYAKAPSFAEDKNYYFDHGAEEVFSVAGKEAPECSAGMFDLIDLEQKNIIVKTKEYNKAESVEQKHQLIYDVALAAARMLLVTRGVDARSESEAFDGFLQNFINAKLVNAKYAELVTIAKSKDFSALDAKAEDVLALGQDLIKLYKSMDDSLQFDIDTAVVQPEHTGNAVAETQVSATSGAAEAPAIEIARSKDLRGVQCPINFVKTKMELAGLQSGDVLEVLLDDGKPIENVPGSCRLEGHNVLEEKRSDEGHWVVLVQKK